MSLATIASAFRTHLLALTLSPALPVVWQNQEFKPEADGGEAGWLYCEVYLTGEAQVSLGASTNIHRDQGVAAINVVIPRGSKIGTAESLCDQVRGHFKSESVSGVHLTDRWIGSSRLSERDARWYVVPVVMLFWADRLEAAA